MSELLTARGPIVGARAWRLAALLFGAVAASAAVMLPRPAAAADVDVGVSIGISRPGVYGRIDIGRYPAPVLVSPTPVWVVPPPVVVRVPPPPVAMWVPPGHRNHWRKHCHRYGACGVPVVFVQDRWVHEQGPGWRDPARARRHGDDRWDGRRDRDDRRWDRDDRRWDRDDRGERRRGKDRDD